jgi:hypothetical protein
MIAKLAVLALALALLANQTPPPAPPPIPSTWILQIEGNAVGLAVTGASVKPFRFRPSRALPASTTSVVLLDAAGKELTRVPLDLEHFCLDPGHVGQPDHVRGDLLQSHRVVCLVKVPALPIAELRIERARDGAPPQLLGRIAHGDLHGLLAASRETR